MRVEAGGVSPHPAFVGAHVHGRPNRAAVTQRGKNKPMPAAYKTKQRVLGEWGEGRGGQGEGISQEGVGELLHLRQSCVDTRVVGRVDVTPAGQPSNANIFTTWTRSTHRLQIATGLQWKGASPRSQTRLVGSYHTAPCGHMNKTHADAACSHMSPAPLLPKAREKHARLFPCGNDGAVVERQRAPRDAKSLLKHYIIILREKKCIDDEYPHISQILR
jgi:hypothetical protein